MIQQRELRAVLAARRRASDLEAVPEVQAWRRATETADGLEAEVRTRLEAGEEVELGRLRCQLSVKLTARVAWEKLLTALLKLPALDRAFSREAQAQTMLRLAREKHSGSPFVSFARGVSFSIAEEQRGTAGTETPGT